MSIDIIKGKYPHVGWVDIEGDGILTEIAIMKNGTQGLFFMKLNQLDAIDKNRIIRIIANRNAHLYELWDLMSNITLGNGANALDYFHQYVKVLTPSGETISPTMGRMAAPAMTGVRTVKPRSQQQEKLDEASSAAGFPTPSGTAPRSRGRPRKNPAVS